MGVVTKSRSLGYSVRWSRSVNVQTEVQIIDLLCEPNLLPKSRTDRLYIFRET